MRFAVVEKEFMGTGQIAYTERVDNYLGYYGIDGFSLGEKFREHAEDLGTEFFEGEVNGTVDRKDGIWKSRFLTEMFLRAKTVIYALGELHPKSLILQAKKSSQAREFPTVPCATGHFLRAKLWLSSAAEILHFPMRCTFQKWLKRLYHTPP